MIIIPACDGMRIPYMDVWTNENGQTPTFFSLSHFCILKLLKYFEIDMDARVCACIEMIADGSDNRRRERERSQCIKIEFERHTCCEQLKVRCTNFSYFCMWREIEANYGNG